MNKIILSLLLASFSLGFPLTAGAADHEHHSHRNAQGLQLNHGKKWETDGPLRQSMGNINQAMAEALPGIHAGRLSDAGYLSLAARVDQEVAYAVEHCKLDAKADAMLHLIIADLTEGSSAMAGKGKISRHDGAAKVLQALQAYGRYFSHPGWKPIGG